MLTIPIQQYESAAPPDARAVVDRPFWSAWWRSARCSTQKSFWRQGIEIASLRLDPGFSIGEYYAYGFGSRSCGPAEISRYAPNRWHWERQIPALNDPGTVPVVRNKLLFYRHCISHGLRTPTVWGVYRPGGVLAVEGRVLESQAEVLDLLGARAETGLVLKPVSGANGAGVIFVRRSEGELVVTRDGVERSGADCVDDVLRSAVSGKSDGGLLVQQYVRPHSTLRRLSSTAAGTVRLVTLRDRGGAVRPVGATLRIGRTGSVVDNFEQGGVSIGIDLASGRLGRGRVPPSVMPKWVEIHPDSGVRFRGRVLPHWQETLELCRRAARSVEGLGAVGWDVLLAQDGPLLLEGNHAWDLVGLQMTNGAYLRPEVADALTSWGVELPERRSWTRPAVSGSSPASTERTDR